MKANLISTITVLGLVSMVPIGAVQAEEANSDEVIEEQVVLESFWGQHRLCCWNAKKTKPLSTP